MLARAAFDQTSGADFALSHAGFFKAIGRLPYGPLHRTIMGLTWLETWLRYPLKTLRILDEVDETFSLLDPDGQRFGLTKKERNGFRRNLLYYQIADLVTLLSGLDRRSFYRQALHVENEEILVRERQRGDGALVLGFRIGAYPALPWVLGSRGLPVSMIVGSNALATMGRELGEAFVPRAAERIQFVNARDPRVLTQCLDVFQRGGIACTLLELSPIEFAKTVDVKFLDWTIQVPYGVAYLSAVTGRSIVPAVLARSAGPRFTLRFAEPLPPPARDRASIHRGTQQLYEILEQHVLQFRDQWIGWTLLNSHMGIEELRRSESNAAPALS